MRRSQPAPEKGRKNNRRAAATKAPPPPLASVAPAEPLIFDLSRSFFELLLRHRKYYVSAIAAEKTPPMLIHVLHYLIGGPCTMRELAKAAMLEPSNLTGIIDKLEARGLATRRESPDDRRIKLVELTPDGRAMRERLIARFSEPAPWMEALSTQDQKRLLEIVRRALAYEKLTDLPSSRTPRPLDLPPPATPAPQQNQGKRTRK